MMGVLERLDHVVLGVAAGLICWRLAALTADPAIRHGDRGPTSTVAATLWILCAIVALAVLVLLLDRNWSQDGLLLGDARLRNVAGAAALLTVVVAGLVWSSTRGTGHAVSDDREESDRSSHCE